MVFLVTEGSSEPNKIDFEEQIFLQMIKRRGAIFIASRILLL